MKKIYLFIILSFLSSNLLANTYTVVVQDNENNTEQINVSNESNLIELINEALLHQVKIKSINLKGETLDAVKRGGGEGGEGG